MLYFDHNATAPLHPSARSAWLDAHERFPANPASAHRLGRRAEVALESARESLAELLGCSSDSLVWTSGATEAANTAIAHLAALSDPGARIWASAIEHPCVLEAAHRWFPGRVKIAGVSRSGALDLSRFQSEWSGIKPAAVVLMAANNETGVLQPWREVFEMCREAKVPFVCDATQWIGRLPPSGLGECDFMFGSAHKYGGPVGTGFLKGPSHFKPLLVGGPQEEGRRGGTQNVAGAMALVAALQWCTERFGGLSSRLEMRSQMESLLAQSLPGVEVLGRDADRLWNTIAFIAPELADCRQRWIVRLDAAGVAASSGSACSSGKEAASHVLTEMAVPAAAADRVLRLSAGWETTLDEWQEVVRKVGAIYERWRVGGLAR